MERYCDDCPSTSGVVSCPHLHRLRNTPPLLPYLHTRIESLWFFVVPTFDAVTYSANPLCRMQSVCWYSGFWHFGLRFTASFSTYLEHTGRGLKHVSRKKSPKYRSFAL